MVATLSIMVEKEESAAKVNELLHVYRGVILGRMGLPIQEKKLAVISIVLDAEPDEINRLAGKLGSTDGVTAKALFAKNK